MNEKEKRIIIKTSYDLIEWMYNEIAKSKDNGSNKVVFCSDEPSPFDDKNTLGDVIGWLYIMSNRYSVPNENDWEK